MTGGEIDVRQGCFPRISFHIYLDNRASVRMQEIFPLVRETIILSDLGKGRFCLPTGFLQFARRSFP